MTNWLRRADIDDGVRPGTKTTENVELRELRKHDGLLEQENEIFRRATAYLSQAHLPR